MEEKEKNSYEFNSDEIPPVSFRDFILGISQSVYIYLGIIPDPISGKTNKNLLLAKHTIDTIEMLKEKTKGNLTQDEENTINYLLTELKFKYLEILKESSSKEKENSPESKLEVKEKKNEES